jgi:hypothetical protein
MMMFKACTRCSGDVREASDMYGRYMQCVQCGHLTDLPDERLVVASANAGERKAGEQTAA